MDKASRLFGMSAVASLLLFSTGDVTGQATKVTLEKIKYADLGKLVRGLKGKIILVDFWAEY